MVEIHITVNDQGQLNLQGPPDKVLVLGLLELAKAAVLGAGPARPDPGRIVPAVLAPGINGGGGNVSLRK